MDTSTMVMGVAVLNEDWLLGETLTNRKKNHSVRLMPAVESLLAGLDMSMRDVQLVAVGMGPGSYTGVRIGVTTAKMMAWALGVPLVGVSTLLTMAAEAGAVDGWICPLIDARRGRVYTGLYRSEAGSLRLVRSETVTVWKDWLEEVLAPLAGPVWLCGEDALLYRDVALASLGERLRLPAPERRLPRPSRLGRLALQWYGGSLPAEHFPEPVFVVAEGADIHRFVPRYLQKTLAEQKLASRPDDGSGDE